MDTATTSPNDKFIQQCGWLFLALCVAVILWFTFKNISDPLLDRHSHRQTHTAITSYYMIHEGAWFPYITPVQGPEWSIPVEFPIYQWTVAVVVKLTGVPLELGGKLVSLIFWWLTLFELFRALRHFVPGRLQRACLLLVVAAAPTSIYWSRSFMIETCALYLSVAFGRQILNALLEKKRSAWGWAILFGTLAALQKITTLFVMDVLIGCGLAVWLIQVWNKDDTRRIVTKHLLLFSLLGAWTLIVASGWSSWAERVTKRNVIAREVTAKMTLDEWHYGTMQQRISPETWKHLASNVTLGLSGSTPGLGYKIPLLLWVVMLFLTRRRLKQTGVLLLSFMAGPLVFFNLYYIHEYYLMANGYLFLLAFGVTALAAWEDSRQWVRRVGVSLLVMFIAGELYAYPRYHSLLISEIPPRQKFDDGFRAMLDANMQPGETLLVYGYHWDSAVAFYARHKCILDESGWTPDDKRMQEMLALLKPEERIGAMIVKGAQRTNEVFLQERIKAFDLEGEPHASFWGDVYFRKRPENEKASR